MVLVILALGIFMGYTICQVIEELAWARRANDYNKSKNKQEFKHGNTKRYY